jgi:mannose-1-phosphate guanylyltransferase/mannose-6-phosphate isomerase
MTTASDVLPVILCGGSGTRLWPLSRKAFPKQFIPLIQNKSLLQLTMERLVQLPRSGELPYEILCVSSESHRFLVADTAAQLKVTVRQILEPQPKNTAAAMALAALSVPPETNLLFCPSDHHIPDAALFTQGVLKALPSVRDGRVVTFGVRPTSPSTAYGYIEKGGPDGSGFEVVRFVEKPPLNQALEYLASGRYLWNAGIFIAKARVLLDALHNHATDILTVCHGAMSKVQSDGDFLRPDAGLFQACRSQSIDYAVMEKATNVCMFPFEGVWSDVGSWTAVAQLAEPDGDYNRHAGQPQHAYFLKSHHTYIQANGGRPVVALGTRDLLIIDTPDALLVAHPDHAEAVKSVVSQLERDAAAQAFEHRRVYRPWGWYEGIDAGDRHQVKRIQVKPGASLSLQMHHHRAEHWVVVRGTAEVTNGNQVMLLTENQSTYIPLGQTHRLANPGQVPLEIIEVQTGSYIGEDDIVRFDDVYGRK